MLRVPVMLNQHGLNRRIARTDVKSPLWETVKNH